MLNVSVKAKAISLRMRGRTYKDIQDILNAKIPKSTLYYWFRNINLNKNIRRKMEIHRNIGLKKARNTSLVSRKVKRSAYLHSLLTQNSHLAGFLKNQNVAKIILAVLYLGEGSKNPERGSLVFGNSDPKVISLFLRLLRKCYTINESKFRCTVQCRADQNINDMEEFWKSITKIPSRQFYKSRIDPRTIGKISVKPTYRGVCRIDYFSAHIFNDLLKVIDVICKGH